MHKVTELFRSVSAQSGFKAVLYIDRKPVDGRPQARNLGVRGCAWTGAPERLNLLFEPGNFDVELGNRTAEDSRIVGVQADGIGFRPSNLCFRAR